MKVLLLTFAGAGLALVASAQQFMNFPLTNSNSPAETNSAPRAPARLAPATPAVTNAPAFPTNSPAGANAPAATNPPASTNAPAKRKKTEQDQRTDIYSDSGDFNIKTRVAIYTGNVRVINPQMNLTCDVLTADVPEGGKRVSHIVALGNVVIDAKDEQGKTVHATSGKAVYNYNVENGTTNETVELTPGPDGRLPYVQSQYVTGSATNMITWDLINHSIRGVGLHTTLQKTFQGGITNMAPAVTDLPTNSP